MFKGNKIMQMTQGFKEVHPMMACPLWCVISLFILFQWSIKTLTYEVLRLSKRMQRLYVQAQGFVFDVFTMANEPLFYRTKYINALHLMSRKYNRALTPAE